MRTIIFLLLVLLFFNPIISFAYTPIISTPNNVKSEVYLNNGNIVTDPIIKHVENGYVLFQTGRVISKEEIDKISFHWLKSNKKISLHRVGPNGVLAVRDPCTKNGFEGNKGYIVKVYDEGLIKGARVKLKDEDGRFFFKDAKELNANNACAEVSKTINRHIPNVEKENSRKNADQPITVKRTIISLLAVSAMTAGGLYSVENFLSWTSAKSFLNGIGKATKTTIDVVELIKALSDCDIDAGTCIGNY